MNTNKYILVFILLIMIFQAGCQKIDNRLVRQEHAKVYKAQLADETNSVLSMKSSYGLNDCISIAMQNNLEIRISQIEENIAKLKGKVAFANFLPVVNLDYAQQRWDRQPKIKFGSTAVAMHDRDVKEVTWQIQMSVFDPSTWFLYEMYKRGEELSKLVTKYSRQTIALDVIVNYYHCLTLMETQQALQSQLNSAQVLAEEISAMYNEGLVTQWQMQQSQLSAASRQTELNSASYAAKQAKADLMILMGLSPLKDMNLNIERPLIEPNMPVEELVYKSLIQNPGLYIADKQIQIEEEKVKMALAAFLPRLTIFVDRTNTSDSFQLYQNYWTYGLAGTMTIFNGFANINEYKAAKENRKSVYIEREQQTLALMLEVYKAYYNVRDAKEQTKLAQMALDTVTSHYNEINENWKEGLVSSSEMLSVSADKDTSQMELMLSNFQLQVSIAVLHNLMGEMNIQDEVNSYGTN